jgi:hypothetical protein
MLESLLEEHLQAFQEGRTDAISVAMSYATLGRKKEAFEYLEKAYQRHDYALISVRGLYPFRGMRDDPQFQELLKRLYTRDASRGTG